MGQIQEAINSGLKGVAATAGVMSLGASLGQEEARNEIIGEVKSLKEASTLPPDIIKDVNAVNSGALSGITSMEEFNVAKEIQADIDNRLRPAEQATEQAMQKFADTTKEITSIKSNIQQRHPKMTDEQASDRAMEELAAKRAGKSRLMHNFELGFNKLYNRITGGNR